MTDRSRKTLLDCLQVAAFVAVLFVATLSTMLIGQHFRLHEANPLAFKELEQMKEAARVDLDNLALREKIRHLDLLSRRAWFSGIEWRQSASRLLLYGALFLVALIGAINAIKPKAIAPEICRRGKRSPASETFALLLVAGICVIAVHGFLAVAGPKAGFSDDRASGDQAVVATNAGVTKRSSPATAEAVVPVTPPLQIRAVGKEELKRNWIGFRGWRNDGRAKNHRAITGWNVESGQGVRWKTKVPLVGYSSPVVFENRLFVTGGDRNIRALFCYEADSGRLLWTHEAKGIVGSPATPPKVSDDTGYAPSTPVTDGNLAFAIFATGDLVAVDYAGERAWAKNLGVPDNLYGYCSSPLLAGKRLIVQYDNNDRQTIFCFEAATGKEIWRQRRDTTISWSSPMLCMADGKERLVTLTCSEAESFDLETGEKRWGQAIMGGEVAPAATANDEGLVFVSSENALTAAIRVASGEVVWRNDNAVMPDVSSPVVFGDMLYLFTSAAVISCLDAASGELLWEKNVKEGFYSSPLALEERIVAFDLKGNLLVVKPDRENLIIEHQQPLGENVLTTPAIAGDKMWVRGALHLYGLEKGR